MIFIAGNVPSSKNSKQWTGKFLISSKTVREYRSKFAYQFSSLENKKKFNEMTRDKEKPYKIGFYFIRDSQRKFDYINIAQIVQDLMVEHEWIVDDNCTELVPVFLGYKIDKENPGVKIEVL